MAEQTLPTYTALLYSGAAVTTTTTTPSFNLALCDSYAFILDVGTPGGTTETLDVAIQSSLDGGTTFQDWWRFTRVTTAAITHCIVVQPGQGHGEAGSVAAVTTGGTGAINNNKSFANPCRIVLTITGTLPTYATIKVWCIGATRNTACD